LEGWLEERTGNWCDNSLDNGLSELRSMSECPWRLVAAALLVKLDLKRQGQLGRKVALEQYLDAYPELGGKEGVAPELIVAEIKAKSKAGVPINLEDYFQTYPNQAAQIRSLIAEASSAAAGSTRKMRTQTPSTPRPVTAAGPAPYSTAPAPAPPMASPRTAKSVPSPRPSAASAPSAQPAQPQAALSEQFGRYRIEKQLGQGGMGSVYKAYDTELHRHVALKVPQFGPDEGAEVLERFKQEARAAATLRHTNLCQVYDVGAIDGTNFLTMEFIEGQSLEGYAAKQPQGVSPRFIALVMTRLARALKTAHAKNVIHRDLKPSNIMLREADGTLEPVIVDFGLARRIEPGTARLTQAGLVIGTWQYMTPEQLCGEPDALGPGCDIYALGVIMYELLTGRLPYDAPGQVVRGNAAPPSSIRADLDPRLEAICLKAMAANGAERYASMGDLATALTEFLKGASDKSPEIKAAIAPSGPTSKQVRPEEPAGEAAPSARSSMPMGKLVAGGLAAAVAFLGVGAAVRSLMTAAPGKGGPAAPEAPSVAKPAAVAGSPLLSANSPERLFDDSRRAIREGKFAAAKATLASYLATPSPSKVNEARALLAELDHALSKDEAQVRAKGLLDAELKKYLGQGVDELLVGIQNAELKDACKAILLDAFREEGTARAERAARAINIASITRSPAATKKAPRPFPPRQPGSQVVPVRELEIGFKLILSGQSFDGWSGQIRRPIPAKKGMPRGTHYVGCPAGAVAERDGITVVSKPVVGILEMEKLQVVSSLKFDYKVTGPGGRAVPRGRNATHAVAEFSLDKPLSQSNMNGCNVIAVSLAADEAGEVTTRRPGNREGPAQNASTRVAHQNGEWNQMEIKCGNRSLQILVNGTEVNRLELPQRINARVAFSFGGVELQLANVWLR
jgi:hypothetical protein